MLTKARKRLLMRGLFLSVGLAALLYCITVCIYVAAQPHTGLYVLVSRRVAKVIRDSGAYEAGIRRGDKIESLAGKRPNDTIDLLYLTRSFRKGQKVPVTFRRPGLKEPTETGLEIKPTEAELEVKSSPFPISLLLWTGLSAGILTTAYIMYLRRPEDKPAMLFYIECVVTVGAFIGALSWHVIIGSPLLFSVFLLCSGLIVPVGLHFFLVYPETSPALGRWRRITTWLYVPMSVYLVGGLLVVGRMAGFIPHSRLLPITQSRFLDVLLSVAVFQILMALCYLSGSVANLYLTYKRTVHSEVRTQIKWVLWGAAISIVPLALLIVWAVESLDS